MELIADNKRLWKEGSMMDHCIYSYLDQAKNRDLFHFHCTFGEKPFSLAVMRKYDGSRYIVQQMFGARNSQCTDAQREIIEQWLHHNDVQDWFKREKTLHGIKPVESLSWEDLDPLPF